MIPELKIYNSLTREKEVFTPLFEGRAGMYVCGPTVYNDVHLGNCRTFVGFDIIYRYLLHLGYAVRYVRNITDVGHLTDGGDDKMETRARLEQLEPMEVAQKYTNGFHDVMRAFNALPPSIEPSASGHIIEQIETVQAILEHGYAYIENGSVYFDTIKYDRENPHHYGALSGRTIDELLAESRDLKNQEEKHHPSDFALWMKASPEHLMRWKSPWSTGFPGWHIECSAMSAKYLGEQFDLHGGGNDLKFPHHENEIAQHYAACGQLAARYWLHTNMLLLNGKKMSKSDGNTISPAQLFTGDNPILTKGYSPMTVRFFMLQAHYRSPLDITDDALQAAEKGYKRLMEGWTLLQNFPVETAASDRSPTALETQISELCDLANADMNDDFNCPRALSRLFELVSIINALKGGQSSLNDVGDVVRARLKTLFSDFIFKIFGLTDEKAQSNGQGAVDGLMNIIIDMRKKARDAKDWGASDQIRDALLEAGVQIKDGKEGATWSKI